MSAVETTPRTDLAWLANRYVLGELTSEESQTFEERLAVDELACSEVARATRCHLALAAALAEIGSVEVSLAPVLVAPRTERDRVSRGVGLLTTVVTAVALVASVALMVRVGSRETGVAKKEGAAKIVDAWAKGEAARNASAEDEDLESAEDADLDPPDWLLAALTVETVGEKRAGSSEVRDQ